LGCWGFRGQGEGLGGRDRGVVGLPFRGEVDCGWFGRGDLGFSGGKIRVEGNVGGGGWGFFGGVFGLGGIVGGGLGGGLDWGFGLGFGVIFAIWLGL